MASKLFLDANIILDFTFKRPGYEPAKLVMEMAVAGQVSAFTSSSIIHIVGYWLTKAYGSAKAKELLSALLDEVEVITTNHETTLLAIQSGIDDIEDALQYHTALCHKLDWFISRDKKLQKAASRPLPVYTPEEFFKVFAP